MWTSMWRVALALVLFSFEAACSGTRSGGAGRAGVRIHSEAELRSAFELSAVQSNSGQLLVVLGDDDTTPTTARFVTIALFERGPGGFVRVIGPAPGVVGKNGFAKFGAKREGDKCSPVGVFTITELFGEDPQFRPKMSYKVVGPDDAWCEDPASPMYNQWLHGEAAKAATDRLKRSDDLYRHAAVIDYNRDPIVPGAGSAIFLHKADPAGAGTLGCVGLDAATLDAVLLRLDPAAKPVIVMGTPRELVKARQAGR